MIFLICMWSNLFSHSPERLAFTFVRSARRPTRVPMGTRPHARDATRADAGASVGEPDPEGAHHADRLRVRQSVRARVCLWALRNDFGTLMSGCVCA